MLWFNEYDQNQLWLLKHSIYQENAHTGVIDLSPSREMTHCCANVQQLIFKITDCTLPNLFSSVIA